MSSGKVALIGVQLNRLWLIMLFSAKINLTVQRDKIKTRQISCDCLQGLKCVCPSVSVETGSSMLPVNGLPFLISHSHSPFLICWASGCPPSSSAFGLNVFNIFPCVTCCSVYLPEQSCQPKPSPSRRGRSSSTSTSARLQPSRTGSSTPE